MPLRLAEQFATFCYDNSMLPLITYAENEFFDASLVAIIAIKDEQLEAFKNSEYFKFATK